MPNLNELLSRLEAVITDEKHRHRFVRTVKLVSIGLTLINLAAVVILCIRETHSAIMFFGAAIFSLIAVAAWGVPILCLRYIVENYPSLAPKLGAGSERSPSSIFIRASILLIPALAFTVYAFMTLPKFVL